MYAGETACTASESRMPTAIGFTQSMTILPMTARPAGWDTDGDGMPDGWETLRGLNPNSPATGVGSNENNVVASNGLTNLENYLRFLNLQASWGVDADGVWSSQLNWRGFTPQLRDATARFGNVISSARTITLDGDKHYLDAWYPPAGSGWNGVTVNYQMDGNYQMASYTTWLDKMTFSYW